jgi:hypothetical protein
MSASPAATGQMAVRQLVDTAQLGTHGLLVEVVGEDAVLNDVVHVWAVMLLITIAAL